QFRGVLGRAPRLLFVFCFSVLRRPPTPPLFPYTTLFRSLPASLVDLRAATRRHRDESCPTRWPARSVWPRRPTPTRRGRPGESRSEEHTSELQSRGHLVCRLMLEKKYGELRGLNLGSQGI